MPDQAPVIEIERIEIVPAIQGRKFCVMAQRVMTYQGQTRYIEPVNLLVGDVDASGLPQVVQAAIASINTQLQTQVDALTAERDSLQTELTQLQAEYNANINDNTAKQSQIAALTAERDARPTQAQLDAANARIAELEAQLSPPNPFPNADWAGFRAAALTDPAVQRVAAGNSVLWPVLFMYLSELSTNPARGKDIAWLWNTMEMQTPVTAEEIQRVNAIAETHGVPLSMNAEGQIVLP